MIKTSSSDKTGIRQFTHAASQVHLPKKVAISKKILRGRGCFLPNWGRKAAQPKFILSSGRRAKSKSLHYFNPLPKPQVWSKEIFEPIKFETLKWVKLEKIIFFA